MNFIDAALHLLREATGPVHVETLCQDAIEQQLLARPGPNPLRSMKARLTTELKRGKDSRVTRVAPDTWGLGGAPQKPAKTKKKAAPVKAKRQGRTAKAPKTTTKAKTAKATKKPKSAKTRPKTASSASSGEANPPASDATASETAAHGSYTPSAEEAVDLYADEDVATQARAYKEYRDRQTADEDRPMTPELVAKRDRFRRGDRRRGERKRRSEDSSRRGSRRERVAAVPKVDISPPTQSLADAAEQALRDTKGNAVQVRQLAQMMRKRRLLSGDPARTWPILKTAMLHDERQRTAHGLRPRFARRRDMFSLVSSGLPEQVVAAEAAFGAAAHHLEAATHEAVMSRLCQLGPEGLERVVHVFLMSRGFVDVSWIKRSGRSSYATARRATSDEQILIGARSGNEPVDRAGVGELRAGVKVKELKRGWLLAPRELDDAAQAERERVAPPLDVLCGAAFVRAVCAEGLGVVRASAPIMYLDADFFEELRRS